jgi:hypothetical protein
MRHKRYGNQSDLAKLLGVSAATVSRWKVKGKMKGCFTKDGRLDLSKAIKTINFEPAYLDEKAFEAELDKAGRFIVALDREASARLLDDLLNDTPERSHKP